jgi:hypothetical protein
MTEITIDQALQIADGLCDVSMRQQTMTFSAEQLHAFAKAIQEQTLEMTAKHFEAKWLYGDGDDVAREIRALKSQEQSKPVQQE